MRKQDLPDETIDSCSCCDRAAGYTVCDGAREDRSCGVEGHGAIQVILGVGHNI